MADEKLYTPREVCSQLAKAIKEKVDTYAGEFEKLRKRELKQRSRKLRKNADFSMCPLCGNPDSPGTCTCLGSGLAKNAYCAPPKTPGMQPATPANPVPGSHGAPAGMAKADLCKGCGKPHEAGKCMGDVAKGDDLWSPESDDNGKVRGSVLANQRGGAKPPSKRSAKDIRGTKETDITPPKLSLGKEEKSPGAKLPPEDGGKTVEASKGSGGDVKKGKKLSKAVTAATAGAPVTAPMAPQAKTVVPLSDLASLIQRSKKPAPAGLPGMTQAPATSLSAESAASIAGAKAAQADAARKPGASILAGLRPKLDAIAGTRPAPAAAPAPEKTGLPVPVANPRPRPTPMAAANADMASARSIVTNPTAMPGGQLMPNAPAPQAPLPSMTGFKSVASNPAQPAAGVPALVKPSVQLAADKRAGGVGFVNNLLSRVRGNGGTAWEDLRGAGPASPGRLLAATALKRSETPGADLKKSLGLGNCVFCGCNEHPGACSK